MPRFRGRSVRTVERYTVEAPPELRAEFKLNLEDLQPVGESHLSLPLES